VGSTHKILSQIIFSHLAKLNQLVCVEVIGVKKNLGQGGRLLVGLASRNFSLARITYSLVVH